MLGIVLGLYIGLPPLNQLRFIARDPILTGILKVTNLPVQSTFGDSWTLHLLALPYARTSLSLAHRVHFLAGARDDEGQQAK